jgi:hypothetical protein
MTDNELERILGAFFRAELPADVIAPAALRSRVATIPGASPESRRPPRHRGFTLLVAAALLTTAIVGGALLGGAGIDPNSSLQVVVAPSSTPISSELAAPSAGPTGSPVPPQAAVWIATGSMGTPRSGHAAVRLLDGRVLVVGGSSANDEVDLTSAELYDPDSGTWSPTGNIGRPLLARRTATLLRDGKVLVLVRDGAEVYDPENGAWTATDRGWSGVLNSFGATATLLRDGKVLVAGVHGAQLYDPTNETWTATGTMTERLFWYTATLLADGKVLAAGEAADDHANESDFAYSAQLYDPGTGTWTGIADLHDRYRTGGFTATLLRSGNVLVAGGVSGSVGSDRSALEIYDPGTDAWTAIGDRRGRGSGYLTAIALSDGTVLLIVIGASYSNQVTEPSAERPVTAPELYDPRTGSWTNTGTMLQPHDGGGSFTLLLDGGVLVAGGLDCSEVIADLCSTGEVTPSAELYIPDSSSRAPSQ